ncbi:hypothetical protein SAMN07250955_102238 [Arboricoccus pini]|uniref:Stringent starvation protein B n=1 Tax=Arboricoccus pini TaxID=1963835 RepID=A0A212QPS4_9PROT|nr:ClpXP protease specificity-enhancing factor SspB [Arboricoccus pini]SNB61435.1 hypothetical protein SAMN07250955_102238 [Arboricoccus pini]
MSKRQLEYGRLVEQALRTVVRDVLQRVAAEGMVGSHHFYITFRTGDPGVDIADYLKERYPGEMTIVLQYQFWELEVDDEGFAVTLSFNNQPERLRIPFSAIKVFADPGAEFGLQFTIEPDQQVVSLPTAPRDAIVHGFKDGAPPSADTADEKNEAEENEGAPDDGAKVVALDRFRKK